jgi:hypothetical protein
MVHKTDGDIGNAGNGAECFIGSAIPTRMILIVRISEFLTVLGLPGCCPLVKRRPRKFVCVHRLFRMPSEEDYVYARAGACARTAAAGVGLVLDVHVSA